MRRPTGISPYGSFSQTPALRGAAAQFRWGAFRLSMAAKTSMRLDAGVSLCHCASWGVLLHAEESVRLPWGNIYLQEGWHRAPQWDDRLYLYERNAPGTFRVPARYGQGWFLHLYFSGLVPRAVCPASLSASPVSASSSGARFTPRLKYYLGLDYQDFTYKSTRHQTLTLRLQLNLTF